MNRFEELEVSIPSTIQLAGTLSVPQNQNAAMPAKHPAILFVAGSGKSDRNGNGGGLDMNLYRKLSDYLASNGYVTLRYDKCGTFGSQGDYYSAGLWDFIDDAEACARFLADRPEVDRDRLFILGHSEGAIIAPVVQTRFPVSGLILLSGFAGDGKHMLSMQMEVVLKELSETKGFKGWLFRLLNVTEKAKKKNAAVVNRVLQSTEPMIKIGLAKINAKWYREHHAFNVLDYFPQVNCPTLALTGDRDIQVDPKHVHIMADLIQGPVEAHIIPEMNHILCQFDGQHTMLGLIKEYKKMLGRPLHPRLLEYLDNWLAKQTINN